jgi:NAD(P)-dependent dehydrogenase (short-subunit alcohol dehydrogenase family)
MGAAPHPRQCRCPRHHPGLEQYNQQQLQAAANNLLTPRMGEPDEVAQAVTYLASDAASFPAAYWNWMAASICWGLRCVKGIASAEQQATQRKCSPHLALSPIGL